MFKTYLPMLVTSAMLIGVPAFAQSTTPNSSSSAKADVTYGRVKEVTPGQKIVVDVNNAPDKSFDLKDQATTVHMTETLQVGDPVKITETKQNGKKMVNIMRASEGGVQHGDKSRAEEERK